MARDITAGVSSQVTGQEVRLGVLFEGDFASGFLRVWTGNSSLSWDSKTWTGLGDLAGISAIEEASELSARNVTFTLSGIPSSTLSIALTEKYRGRDARSWLAFFDSSWNVISDPYQWFAGRMDVMTITESGETATVQLSCENRMVDLRRPRVSRYTASEQERRFTGDLGCEYVARLAEVPIYWGVPNPKSTGTAVGGGGANAGAINAFVR